MNQLQEKAAAVKRLSQLLREANQNWAQVDSLRDCAHATVYSLESQLRDAEKELIAVASVPEV